MSPCLDFAPSPTSVRVLVPDEGLTGNAEAGVNRCAAAAPATVRGEAMLETPLVQPDREGEHRQRTASQETCQQREEKTKGRGVPGGLLMAERRRNSSSANDERKPDGSGEFSVQARLSICFRCKPEGWRGDDSDRPGASLAVAIEAEAARRGFDLGLLRDVHCMSQCKRPCVVAFSGEGRFTYLFGDLAPDRDASAVLDAFALYCAMSDGFMERFERPEALQAGILGRVPPLISGVRQVEPRPAPVEPT